jgi:hypothetical protein
MGEITRITRPYFSLLHRANQHTDDLPAPRWVLVEAIDDEFGARYRMHSMNATGGKSKNVDQYCWS